MMMMMKRRERERNRRGRRLRGDRREEMEEDGRTEEKGG